MGPWVRALVLWAHLAGVVVWFGAIAHFLLVLRPAMRDSGMERGQWYLLLRQVKRRLRRVVGCALAVIVATGAVQAHARGLLRWDPWAAGWAGRVFAWKLLAAGAVAAVFLFSLPLIDRIEVPARRGRAFVWTHVAALALGSVAAFLGLLLHG